MVMEASWLLNSLMESWRCWLLHVTLVVDLNNLDKVIEWGIDPSLGSESAGVAVRFRLILVSHTTLSTDHTHRFRNYQKATLQLEGAILLLDPIT